MKTKKTLIWIAIFSLMLNSIFAIGVDIPFTEKRITFFENGFVSVQPQKSYISAQNIPAQETYQKSGSIKYVGSGDIAAAGQRKLYVGTYVSQYPEIAKDYQGKVFLIETDKRTLKGYLEGDYLIEDNNLDPEYTIKVKSEDDFLQLFKRWQEGEIFSFPEIEKQVEMPMQIRFDIIKTGILI